MIFPVSFVVVSEETEFSEIPLTNDTKTKRELDRRTEREGR